MKKSRGWGGQPLSIAAEAGKQHAQDWQGRPLPHHPAPAGKRNCASACVQPRQQHRRPPTQMQPPTSGEQVHRDAMAPVHNLGPPGTTAAAGDVGVTRLGTCAWALIAHSPARGHQRRPMFSLPLPRIEGRPQVWAARNVGEQVLERVLGGREPARVRCAPCVALQGSMALSMAAPAPHRPCWF